MSKNKSKLCLYSVLIKFLILKTQQEKNIPATKRKRLALWLERKFFKFEIGCNGGTMRKTDLYIKAIREAFRIVPSGAKPHYFGPWFQNLLSKSGNISSSVSSLATNPALT